jgi:hypothetical protein
MLRARVHRERKYFCDEGGGCIALSYYVVAGQGRAGSCSSLRWIGWLRRRGPARSLLACLPDCAVLYGLYYLHGPFVDSWERTPGLTSMDGWLSTTVLGHFLGTYLLLGRLRKGENDKFTLLQQKECSEIDSYLYGVSHS